MEATLLLIQKGDLCKSIVRLTKRLCATYVDPNGLAPLIACQLVALDKSPEICPIGVQETLRWRIGKMILQIAREVIQICAGQEATCESTACLDNEMCF